jgi:periplasmic protein TonB
VLRLTTLGLRISAFGLSGAVHAALFLGPLGHPSAAQALSLEPTLVDIQVESPPEPPREPAPIDMPLENRATAMPTHTHPYPVPADHDLVPHDPSIVHQMSPAKVPAVAPLAPPSPEAVVDTSTTLTASTDMPKFTMAISTGGSTGAGVAGAHAAASGVGTAHPDDGDGTATLSELAVDSPARLVHGGSPNYPSDARAEGVEANVRLELVVSAFGKVEDVRVLRHAGHGLDEAAIGAARDFQFSPALKNGHAVRVRMSWAVEFRLD